MNLQSVVKPFISSKNINRQQYGKDLEESIEALVRDRATRQTRKTSLRFVTVVHESKTIQQSLAESADAVRTSHLPGWRMRSVLLRVKGLKQSGVSTMRKETVMVANGRMRRIYRRKT